MIHSLTESQAASLVDVLYPHVRAWEARQGALDARNGRAFLRSMSENPTFWADLERWRQGTGAEMDLGALRADLPDAPEGSLERLDPRSLMEEAVTRAFELASPHDTARALERLLSESALSVTLGGIRSRPTSMAGCVLVLGLALFASACTDTAPPPPPSSTSASPPPPPPPSPPPEREATPPKPPDPPKPAERRSPPPPPSDLKPAYKGVSV